MAIYVVSFDLNLGNVPRNYQVLYNEINRYEARMILDSAYLVSTPLSAKALLEDLIEYVDPEDRLWVSRVRKDEYWCRAKIGTVQWLERNPPS